MHVITIAPVPTNKPLPKKIFLNELISYCIHSQPFQKSNKVLKLHLVRGQIYSKNCGAWKLMQLKLNKKDMKIDPYV
jgi:hypothetical protein